MDNATKPLPLRPFGPTKVIDPQADHQATIILLHGRGSNGEEFADELFSSSLTDGASLLDKLPGFRWVFPSSKELLSTTFQEDMPAWFEAHYLTDIAARQDLQIGGIIDSVQHVQKLIDAEVEKLHGQTGNVFLGGISQGGAVGLWTLLCQPPARNLGGFFGASTWLPFAAELQEMLEAKDGSQKAVQAEASDAFRDLCKSVKLNLGRSSGQGSPQVFLGHGVDDAYVDVTLGKQAKDVLLQAGFIVEWNEYSGAEEEGHWLKEPEEVEDMCRFIHRILVVSRGSNNIS